MDEDRPIGDLPRGFRYSAVTFIIPTWAIKTFAPLALVVLVAMFDDWSGFAGGVSTFMALVMTFAFWVGCGASVVLG